MISWLLLPLISASPNLRAPNAEDSFPTADTTATKSSPPRSSIGLSIQGISPEAPPALKPVQTSPGAALDALFGIGFAEGRWMDLRFGLGSNLDSGTAFVIQFGFLKELGKLSRDTTIRLRTESKGIRFALQGERSYPLHPLLSVHGKAGIAYRWGVGHTRTDTLVYGWGTYRSVATRSEWQSGFFLPLGAGLQIKPRPDFRLVAGLDFEPTWTTARIRFSDEKRNLSGSGFRLSSSPVWSLGVDWLFRSHR